MSDERYLFEREYELIPFQEEDLGLKKKKGVLSMGKNNYYEKPKETTISTPLGISKYIFDTIHNYFRFSNNLKYVLDVGCGRGNLTYFFNKNANYFCIGIDKTKIFLEDNANVSIKQEIDFLTTTTKNESIDIILCNPPWNNPKNLENNKNLPENIELSEETMNKYSKKFEMYNSTLYPYIFLRHIFEIYGYRRPVVLLSPFGFLYNNDVNSHRYEWIRDNGAKITNITILPKNIFKQVKY
ncbi:MAG: hypothetical protein A2086_17300, partial [Spirochaetes bacterium GWD1_27_9]